MKKITSLIVLSVIALSSFAQEMKSYDMTYRATYEMSFRRDSLDSKRETVQAYLSFNDSESVFRTANKHRTDSVRYELLFGSKKPVGGQIFKIGLSQENNIIVKERDKVTTFENLFIVKPNDVNYVFEEEKTDFQWEIKDDTATIQGYLCQRATLDYGNRTWLAWFTSEIPVSDGPYRFSGLPGLIVKIVDSTDSWRFELLGLVKSPELAVVNFDKSIKYKKVEKKEFYEQKRYLLDNIAHLKMGGSVAGEGNSRYQALIKQVEEVRKIDNNWIELYP